MSTKNTYLFKIVIRDTQTGREIPPEEFKDLFEDIFRNNLCNNALKLTADNIEPMILDIIEDTDEYLFARLSRKRPNNSMQKRDYTTYEISDVLEPWEINNNGVEWFTYCILGYSHGILSIVKSKGAPSEIALAQIFYRYNNRYFLETEAIPNQDLIEELLDGRDPEINRVEVEIAQPSAQMLEQAFGFSEHEVIESVRRQTSSITFDIKPNFRSSLLDRPELIRSLVNALRRNHNRYTSVVISGKRNSKEKQRKYDLYEEYFKYPITVKEYQQENGEKIERDRQIILREYRAAMMNVYNGYRDIILAITNRE